MPAGGFENATVSSVSKLPLSDDVADPSGKTTVAIRSFGPSKLIVTVASTDASAYAPAGTARSIACVSAPTSVSPHSLVALAPGKTVPCHVTVTVCPTVVGTATASCAWDVFVSVAAVKRASATTETDAATRRTDMIFPLVGELRSAFRSGSSLKRIDESVNAGPPTARKSRRTQTANPPPSCTS